MKERASECIASFSSSTQVGLTNYPAAYCTGLLLARRVLTQFKLDETFVGVEEPDGELNEIENDEETDRRPFKAILDAGLKKTTTGSKIFGALKVRWRAEASSLSVVVFVYVYVLEWNGQELSRGGIECVQMMRIRIPLRDT